MKIVLFSLCSQIQFENIKDKKISTGVWVGVCQGEIFISFMMVISLQSQYCHLLSVAFRNSIGSNRIHSPGYTTSLFVFRSRASSEEEMFEYYHNHKVYEFFFAHKEEQFLKPESYCWKYHCSKGRTDELCRGNKSYLVVYCDTRLPFHTKIKKF